MLKLLHKDDTQTTPFVATKNWELSNVTNGDLILMEHSGSDGLPVALEYLEYSTNSLPITASGCNIALEQQSENLATLREGLKVTGLFYPDQDPQNIDGTYKRMIYAQVSNMFYNTYRDPTKIWGTETLDFELSKTEKFVSDRFRLIDVPTVVFGEKMLPSTVVLYDTTTDNNYTITDDGNCNLFAGSNLFSKQQELGEYQNNYLTGSSDLCDYYNTISLPNVPVLYSFLLGTANTCSAWNNIFTNYDLWATPWGYCTNCANLSIYLSWNINDWPVVTYILEKSLDGIIFNQSTSFNGLTNFAIDSDVSSSTTYWYRVYAENLFGTSSFSNVVSQTLPTASIFWNTDPDYWDAPVICGAPFWNV